MVIKSLKVYSMIAGCILLSFSCKKPRNVFCPKEGYEYIHTNSHCWYSPLSDSLPVGSIIILEASLPKNFIDETRNITVNNTASIVEGPLGVGMIYPIYQAAADSFEITAEIGKVIKDTLNFSAGMLKGFRTIEWDGSSVDSFKIKIKIKALAKGIYGLALKQQSAKDKDCALYKYFLSPGNANQHLNYWMDVFGNVSDQVNFFTYCFKVY
jgi:hypothetical protein